MQTFMPVSEMQQLAVLQFTDGCKVTLVALCAPVLPVLPQSDCIHIEVSISEPGHYLDQALA